MARKPRKKKPAKSKLTPNQRRQDRSAIYDPITPLTGHRLAEAARAITDIEFKPRQSALDRQGALEQANQGALAERGANYYRQLAEQEAGRQDRMKAITGEMQGQLDTGVRQTATRLGEIEKSANQTLAGVAPGLEGGANTRVAEELAAARARAAADQGAAQSTLTQTAGNYGGLLTVGGQAQALRGQETQRQMAVRAANQQTELGAKRTELETLRGEAIAKNVTGLRQSSFENIATLRGLGLDEAKLAADVQQSQADQTLDEQRASEAARHNRASESAAQERISLGRTREERQAFKERWQRQHNMGQFTPKNIPEGQRKVLQQISETAWDYQRIMRKQYKGKPRTSEQTMAALRASGKTTPAGRQAARDIALHGYLMPETAKQLEATGITIPREWRLPPRPRRPNN